MQTGFFWLVFNPLKSSPLGALPAEMGAWQQPSLPEQYDLLVLSVSIGTGSPEPLFSAATATWSELQVETQRLMTLSLEVLLLLPFMYSPYRVACASHP